MANSTSCRSEVHSFNEVQSEEVLYFVCLESSIIQLHWKSLYSSIIKGGGRGTLYPLLYTMHNFMLRSHAPHQLTFPLNVKKAQVLQPFITGKLLQPLVNVYKTAASICLKSKHVG